MIAKAADELLRRRIDDLYKQIRRTEIGIDPRIGTSILATWVFRRVAQRFRAITRGYPGSFVGIRFRRKSTRQIFVGNSVSIGDGVTIDALSTQGIHIGDHCTIDDFAVLRGSGVVRNLGEGIRIGENTSIGTYNVILGQGGVEIGRDCLIGPNVTILSENHNSSEVAIPMRSQGETRLRTVIGNDVWIGAGVVVLGGSMIGDGVVIAAGAVVRGEIGAYTIVGGVPARLIRNRVGEE